jgi:hypothetical protein
VTGVPRNLTCNRWDFARRGETLQTEGNTAMHFPAPGGSEPVPHDLGDYWMDAPVEPTLVDYEAAVH